MTLEEQTQNLITQSDQIFIKKVLYKKYYRKYYKKNISYLFQIYICISYDKEAKEYNTNYDRLVKQYI